MEYVLVIASAVANLEQGIAAALGCGYKPINFEASERLMT